MGRAHGVSREILSRTRKGDAPFGGLPRLPAGGAFLGLMTALGAFIGPLIARRPVQSLRVAPQGPGGSQAHGETGRP